MAIITISHTVMSGGEALAKCLADALGYPVVGREALVEAAAKLGVPEEALRKKIQTAVGSSEKLTTDRRVYLVALQSALAADLRSRASFVEVHADGGKVQVFWHPAAGGAAVGSPQVSEEQVREIASNVEGVKGLTPHRRDLSSSCKVA